MKLLILNIEGNEQKTLSLLKTAAEELQISIIEIDPTKSLPSLNRNEDYLLYRICVGHRQLEIDLFNQFKCTSFAADYSYTDSQTKTFQRVGLTIPKTFWQVELENLEDIVNEVGFPLVIKRFGGFTGIGIMRVDNMTNCVKVIELLKQHNDRFLIQKFIPHLKHARQIVLGNNVVGSIENTVRHGDFRSNREWESRSVPKNFSTEMQDIAITATRALGYEFGGVDIIWDEENIHYVLEVNFPCYFTNTQLTTNIPIAKMMIEYLRDKCEKNRINYFFTKHKPTHQKKIIFVNFDKATDSNTQLIRKAAASFNMELIEVVTENDFAKLNTNERYVLLRNTGASRDVEIKLFNTYSCTSLADNYAIQLQSGFWQYQAFINNNVSTPRKLIPKERHIENLQQQIESIGGVPIILRHNFHKTIPDHIKFDSFESFISVFDYLRSKNEYLQVQEYIPLVEYAYCVIIGESVIASFQRFWDDMQHHLYSPVNETLIPKDYPPIMQQEAIKAVKSLGIDAGLVYMSISEDGHYLVDQVHYPFNFNRIQRLTGIPVIEKMIRYLLDKAEHAIK